MESLPLVVEAGDTDQLAFSGKVVQVAAGNSHSLALTQDGYVFQWGQRNFQRPSLVPSCYPAGGKHEEPLRGVAVAAGDSVSAIVDTAGRIFSWGNNRLSRGKQSSIGFGEALPIQPAGAAASDTRFSSVSVGSQHGAAIVGRAALRSPPTLSR
jgi:alpha-tubulin suppressor-like RCC1 family protein